MIKKYGDPAPTGKVKVKILRGYQSYEIGSIVDLPEKDIKYLLGRKVIYVLTGDEPEIKEAEKYEEEKAIREQLRNETRNRQVEPQLKRAVGLEAEKLKKRGRKPRAK